MNERNDMQAKLGTTDRRHTILIIGISRGIGRGLAAEYLRRGWFVIGTVRSSTVAPELEAMAAGMAGRLRVERLDMTRPSEIGTLRERLADVRERLADDRLDILIVNAGISDHNVPVAEIDEAAFNEVMSTNALAPLKVIESLQDLVVERGTIAVMSSRQGSISLNDRGTYDVYRASKAALNHLVRSYAARHSGGARTLLLIAPGRVQTDLGGSDAPVTVEQVVPRIIDTIDSHRSAGGLHFVNAENEVVPW
jgi:NAD(P)-dependent dehydrogenase (short-subunit alcohol dehydrogenase family)